MGNLTWEAREGFANEVVPNLLLKKRKNSPARPGVIPSKGKNMCKRTEI